MANVAPIIPVVDQSAILNKLTGQLIGSDVIVADDLSNLIDFGSAYENLTAEQRSAVTGQLVTLVTEQLFIVKDFVGTAPDVIRSRETGGFDTSKGLIQKSRPALPKAIDDSAVYDPTPGTSSDPFVNHGIDFQSEYFSKPISARYEWSQPERWMSGAFLSRNGFTNMISAVSKMVNNAITLNVDAVTYAQLRASIALNLQGTSPRAVNLLKEFNETTGSATPLLAANAMTSPDFLRWAIHRIFNVLDYMKGVSRFYNEKDYPSQVIDPNVIFLSQFRRAAENFMLSDVFQTEYLSLPGASTVPAWKGLLGAAGGQPNFESASTVKDKFDFSAIGMGKNTSVKQSGVIAHVFDSERIGIYDLSTTTASMFDPVGLKTNFFTHVWGKGLVDPFENAVTFYVADTE